MDSFFSAPGGLLRPAAYCAALFLMAVTHAFASPVSPNEPVGGGNTNITNAGSTPGAPPSWIGTVDGVNTGTGNKLVAVPITGWTARGGLPVNFSLFFNNLNSSTIGAVGLGWTTSYDISLSGTGSYITVAWGDGSGYTFTKNGSVFTDPPGIHDTLTQSGSNYTLTTKNQITYTFQPFNAASGTVNLATSIADENGNVIDIVRNTNGTLSKVIELIDAANVNDPVNRTITFAYAYFGTAYLLSTITDPLGRKWTLGYDDNSPHDLFTIYQPTLDQTGHAYQFAYKSPYSNGITSEQDLNGNTTTFAYDDPYSSGISSETDPCGNTTSFTYGTTTTVITDPNGYTRTDTYDTLGRLTGVKDTEGYSDTYKYDNDNNVLTHTDKNGNAWTYTYDTQGNRLTALDPRNAALKNPPVKYTYTPHNRLATVTKPSGIAATLAYDGHDNLTTVTESYAGQSGPVTAATTTINYPTSPAPNYGLPVSKKDADYHVTQYTFDTDGDLASVTTPLGNKTQWVYDALGFPTQRTDALNRATKYAPDAWERLVTATYPDSSKHTFGYDYNGNLTAFADGVTVTRSYDKDNRLTTESYNGTVELTNTYDATYQLGLRATSKHGTQTVSYTYTDRNQLCTVADNAGSNNYVHSALLANSGYDADGNLTNAQLANGATVVKTYDADSSLSGLTNALPGGQGASAFSYGYDLDGRMSSGTDYTGSTPSTLSWTYDGQSHLASESRSGGYGPFHDGFALDGVGNRSQLTNIYGTYAYTYDTDDELKNYANGGYTFGYNANGDMTSGTLNGHVSNLSYDYDDQLTSISSQNGTVSYAYDAIGRRVSREDTSGVTHSFIYDGSNLVGEYNDTTSTWDTEYTYGNGLIDKQGTGGTEYQFYDGLGDVYQTLNASGNYVLSGEVADDFGQHFGPAGTLGTDDLFYKWRGDDGYRWDGDGLWTGSYNEPIVEVGARYYIPSMGVFITRDTDLSQRPYEYCDADPVNNVDPSGHDFTYQYKTPNSDGSFSVTKVTVYDDGSSLSTTTNYNSSGIEIGTSYATSGPNGDASGNTWSEAGSYLVDVGGLVGGYVALTALAAGTACGATELALLLCGIGGGCDLVGKALGFPNATPQDYNDLNNAINPSPGRHQNPYFP